MSAETAAANTATTPVPEIQEQEGSKSKQVNLTPAPLPTSSPWKLAPSEVPVSTISIEDLDATRKKKNRTPTPKSSTATKWVPIKASITVSGTKRSGSKNGGSNGNNNKSKNNKTAASSTSSNANRKKKHHQHNAKKQQQQQLKKEGYEPTGEEDLKDTTSQENGQSTQQQPPSHHRNHHHSSNGPQRRKFHNSNNAGMPQNQGFQPQFKPYQGRNPRPNHNNRLKYHSHIHHNHHPQQPMVKVQQQFYPVQPVLMAINNIARQIEYYFSEENLTVDNYLRSKLSQDGFAPLSLISKFYRVVNMSFGGDENLILAALREIVANENATVNVSEGSWVNKETENVASEVKEASLLDKYFIRSKSWSNWLPETFETEVDIEKELTGNALDQFIISLPPAPQEEAEPSIGSTTQEQEIKEDSAVTAVGESESS
ncbi:hypothetical protein SMKI_03G0300 [Saccharomyces mikatae IFO 1815]|uniref:HTH La-type RNA-binding domain-containing protein n=1 Tax=Saccharomyces mikatae IFO 1815 TaxID=226126 RepID=A0AA35IWP1_SACMI|nr:uncharacterized protein SMKI_03G0300 [Saccharomyces mikatae IFO 1815]CAI4037557.1 hypothetical protein SMKI_03G0300 [Saccharomyces mikatae IFO 1815]